MTSAPEPERLEPVDEQGIPASDLPAFRRSLRAELQTSDRASVVRLIGELDADDAPTVRALLAEQVLRGPGSLVVDLSRLTFIDSAGLAALVAAHKGTRSAGTSLVLAAPTPAVVKVLAITGLSAVLMTAPTVEHALEQLGDL